MYFKLYTSYVASGSWACCFQMRFKWFQSWSWLVNRFTVWSFSMYADSSVPKQRPCFNRLTLSVRAYRQISVIGNNIEMKTLGCRARDTHLSWRLEAFFYMRSFSLQDDFKQNLSLAATPTQSRKKKALTAKKKEAPLNREAQGRETDERNKKESEVPDREQQRGCH